MSAEIRKRKSVNIKKYKFAPKLVIIFPYLDTSQYYEELDGNLSLIQNQIMIIEQKHPHFGVDLDLEKKVI